jgi:hypothetical protein
LDCVFLDGKYCTAAAIELDPDTGCRTYQPRDDIELEDWDEHEDLDDWDDIEEEDDDDEDLWIDEEEDDLIDLEFDEDEESY